MVVPAKTPNVRDVFMCWNSQDALSPAFSNIRNYRKSGNPCRPARGDRYVHPRGKSALPKSRNQPLPRTAESGLDANERRRLRIKVSRLDLLHDPRMEVHQLSEPLLRHAGRLALRLNAGAEAGEQSVITFSPGRRHAS